MPATENLKSHITTHLRTRFPGLAPANAERIVDKLVEEVASGPGHWMPDQDQVAGLASAIEKANPAWFVKVPSAAELTEHLIAKNGVTSPTDKLRIGHEVQSLDADGRLALLGNDKIAATHKAQEPPARRKSEPTLQERCEAAALDFHGQSASARLSQARAIARGESASKPDTAGAARAAGREMRPVEKLKAAREAARR